MGNETLEKEQQVVEPKIFLDITIDGNDTLLLLDALREYSSFLSNSKKRTNQIVIDEDFSRKIDSKIKRIDELRFLIEKKILIVDKKVEICSTKDEGKVVRVETFEETDGGRVVTESKPRTIGHTTPLPPKKVKKVKTLVQQVSED